MSDIPNSSYSYQDFINPPNRVGITSDGSLNGLGKDIAGLSSYGDFLTSGSGRVSTTGRPLGNKYWHNTGGKCNAVTDPTGKEYTDPTLQNSTSRWLYVNNVPTGSNKGLIPGIIEDLTSFTHLSIANAFNGDSNPPCQSVNLETIDSHNNRSNSSNYVALMDLQNVYGCTPINGSKLYSGLPLYKCKNENFDTMTPSNKLPDNIIDQFFLLSICITGIYILYRIHK